MISYFYLSAKEPHTRMCGLFQCMKISEWVNNSEIKPSITWTLQCEEQFEWGRNCYIYLKRQTAVEKEGIIYTIISVYVPYWRLCSLEAEQDFSRNSCEMLWWAVYWQHLELETVQLALNVVVRVNDCVHAHSLIMANLLNPFYVLIPPFILFIYSET